LYKKCSDYNSGKSRSDAFVTIEKALEVAAERGSHGVQWPIGFTGSQGIMWFTG